MYMLRVLILMGICAYIVYGRLISIYHISQQGEPIYVIHISDMTNQLIDVYSHDLYDIIYIYIYISIIYTIYIYIHIYIHKVYTCMYIYIYTEREIEGEET